MKALTIWQPYAGLIVLDGRAHPRVTRDDAEHTAGLAERAGLAVTRETWRGEGT